MSAPGTPPVALTIAGSDSGGGAGIQADLRTFAGFGVHGTCAITALTAQNTSEVRGVQATPAGFVRQQIEAVLDDLPVLAVKTGMLATVAIVAAVAELAAAGRLPNLVVDPVMVSSSGRRLLDPEAEQAYVELLIPHATVVTPNAREAAALLGWEPIDSLDRQRQAAASLGARSAPGAAVVVKGGDLAGVDPLTSVDIVWCDGGGAELWATRVPTRNNHGTGCSFAAAIAARLARGDDIASAIEGAKSFVHAAIVRAAGWRLGEGHGPIDHLDFAHPVADRSLDRRPAHRGTTGASYLPIHRPQPPPRGFHYGED
jgi:hydroxymethylpyrimidine/phosphomethylpyrimidine kinase